MPSIVRTALVAAALGLLPVAAFAVEELRAGAKARIFEPTLVSDEFFTESFTAAVDLDDGTYLTVQLGVSNAGPGDGHGACRVMIARKGERSVSKAVVVDREGWRFDASPDPTFAAGACKMVASKAGVTVSAPIEGATVELTFDAAAEKLRTPALSAGSGDDFYDLEILVPWSRVKARVGLPGEAPKDATGGGYLDHSRATALPKKTARRWVRFYGLTDKSPGLVLAREPARGSEASRSAAERDESPTPEGHSRAGWVWLDKKPRAPLTRLQLTPTGKGREASWRVMMDGEGGPWRITTKELLHRDAPLEEHGWLGAVIGAVVGNPVTYTYRAVMASKADRRELAGVVDIAISDE